MAYIYQIVNDINDKVYIGKTEFSIEKRWKEHKHAYRKYFNRPLYAAMRKYGVEHFHIELIEECDNAEEREAFWIEKKQSFKYGYNATKGGDGKKYLDYDLIIATYEILQNIKETAKKLNISPDSVSQIVKTYGGKIKTSTEINKEKSSKPVKMLTINNEFIQIFSSAIEAAKFLIDNKHTDSLKVEGVAAHIGQCANGKRKTAYKFKWQWQ